MCVSCDFVQALSTNLPKNWACANCNLAFLLSHLPSHKKTFDRRDEFLSSLFGVSHFQHSRARLVYLKENFQSLELHSVDLSSDSFQLRSFDTSNLCRNENAGLLSCRLDHYACGRPSRLQPLSIQESSSPTLYHTVLRVGIPWDPIEFINKAGKTGHPFHQLSKMNKTA